MEKLLMTTVLEKHQNNVFVVYKSRRGTSRQWQFQNLAETSAPARAAEAIAKATSTTSTAMAGAL
jgi:hypothetical protein